MLDDILAKLRGVKRVRDGYMALCPCHPDKHPSLSVREVEGKLLLYCHAGCSFESIIKALDLPQDETNPVITDTYDYTDAEGNLLYQVVRYFPKDFKQRRPDGEGWIWDLKGTTPTLYRLPEVLKAIANEELVFIVEGEKDAINLLKIGQVATTISGGSSAKWHPSLVPLFEGARVAIIPDNDSPGRKYASYVANLLYGWCSSLKVVTLRYKDVSDHLALDYTTDGKSALDNLLKIVDNTQEYIPTGAVTREEFQAFRGVNLYLWHLIKERNRPKSQWS